MPLETDPQTAEAPLYLEALNPEQREAVEHFEGPLLVLAGAGSGKTRVLTARICHLIHHHGVAPDRILAVTFTNKAAGEMRERIARILGGEPAGMWCGTFHSLGARILRRHAHRLGWTRSFTIYDADQSLRQIKKTQEILDVDPKRWNPKAIRSEISGAKDHLITPQEFHEDNAESFDLFARQVAKVYPEYQKALEEQNAFDFDDLLVKPVELFRTHGRILDEYRSRFQFVLVDEYQDTNHAQFKLLELLSSEHGNLMVVGDDDQSIYGWRGADLRNILEFEESFPGAHVVRLEQNYRSTERILDAANAVIRQNVNRKGKTLRTERSGGEVVTVVETADETDEARWIVDEIERRLGDEPERPARDFAVLYRTNAQSRALEDAFRRGGLPYQIVGGVRFYERREIQDVLAYLRLISNPRDADAFDRAVGWPRRGVGAVTQERLARFADREGIALLEAAQRATEADEIPTAGARSLEEFAALIQKYSGLAARLPVGELLEDLVEELQILKELRDEGPDGEDRAENVKELIAGALDFDAELLEEMEELPEDRFTELDLFLQRV
ncbi:MAG: UvrD-helicase domain-containing protein, partial [Gemmatimonadetes bacterium]|nr:UvrD-helicase domain-containing protein [Gemmatimonadota bacterium]NIR77739.1 UvrD-helicase domain-containing protein [Gemmatimonadota bacterium]NIT86276.1 UvrD-helicase domain-containing protein [Gemmatimonadota bacterium]NIU30109.1 UvrD-helicase domain-containing protein [Gemmatimonadota bacterium]NIU35055.1 UvrD-helicase domain-containing protein [Gemmatimonadota bacterium]